MESLRSLAQGNRWPEIMADDDDETTQLGHREADSLSGDYLSTEDLESAVLDSSEDRLDMHALLPITNSNSQEDEDTDWGTPEILTPDHSGAIPQINTQQIFPERDRGMAETESLPTSLEVMFPTSLMEDTDFTIEKVLGETTANILMEAEVAASRFANEFKQLEATFDSETDVAGPHSILTCRICQLFVRTVDRLLDRSDELMDHYLPLTEEEIANLKKAAEEMDDPVGDSQVQACLDRINNLSSKLRQRAYMMALSKLRMARRNTQESLCQLHQTINLIGQVQDEDHPQSHQSFRKLSAMTVEWTQRRSHHSLPPPFEELKETPSGDEEFGPPVAESTRTEVGPPAAESTRTEVGAPVAESTRVDDLGPPLAQSSAIEQTVEFNRASEAEPPALEISHAELTAAPEALPKKDLPPPAERSHVEKTRTPPPEVSCADHISLPAVETSCPEVAVKPAMGISEHIYRDMANITVTSPACDKQDNLALGSPPAEDDSGIPPSEMEANALEMSRSLARNLRGTYENLLVHLKDLPEDLKRKLCQTCRDMAELGSDFDSAHRFGDLPRSLLNKSVEVMAEAQCSMDELMEYALQSPEALLWLKDHLSNLEDPELEHVLREHVPLPDEGEEEVVSRSGKIEEEWDLIKLQEAYDPKGCKEDKLPGQEELEAPPAGERWTEDILGVQRAYDPQGCKEEDPGETEKQEGPPGGEPAWNLMEMLQGYLPKAQEENNTRREVEEVQLVEEEAVAERNILEIQQAQDPKGCDEDAPLGEPEVVPPSSEWELEGLLQIQEAYDPKECQEGGPPRKGGDKAVTPSEWNVMKFLQAYAPKMPTNEVSAPEKKDEVGAPAKEEADEPKSTETEKVSDPKTSISGTQETRNLIKIQQAYDPQGCDEDTHLGEEEKAEEVPPSSRRDGEDILKLQQAYDPQGCEDHPVPVREKTEAAASAKTEEWNFLKILQSYIPRSRSQGGSPGAEATPPPSAGPRKVQEESPSLQDGKEAFPPQRTEEPPHWDILKIQEAQDPKGCKEENS